MLVICLIFKLASPATERINVCSPLDKEYQLTDCDVVFDPDDATPTSTFEKALIEEISKRKAASELSIETDSTMAEDYIVPISLSIFTDSKVSSKFPLITFDGESNLIFELTFKSTIDYSSFDIEIAEYSHFLCTDDSSSNIELKLGKFKASTADWSVKWKNQDIENAKFIVKSLTATASTYIKPITKLELTSLNKSAITLTKSVDLFVDVKPTSILLNFTTQTIKITTKVHSPIEIKFSSGRTGSFIINSTNDIKYENYPAFTFNGFSSLTQNGVFTSIPSDYTFISFITSKTLKVLNFESSFIPFVLDLSAIPDFVLTRDLTFACNVSASTLGLKNEGSDVYTVKFIDKFTGSIKIYSPYVKLGIGYYDWLYSTDLPLISFNDKAISIIEINSSDQQDYLTKSVSVIPYITKFLNDADLVANKFDEGKPFLVFNTPVVADYKGSVYYDSALIPEASKTIHGFNSMDNCLSLIVKTEGGKQSFYIKSTPVSKLIRHVKYGTCHASSGMSTENETDLSNLVSSGLLPPGHDLLSIRLCQSLTKDIDLSALDQSIKALELTVEGQSYGNKFECNFIFNSDQTNVKELSVKYTKFTKAQSIICPAVKFENIDFGENADLTFSKDSCLTIDSDSIYLMSSNSNFNNLTIVSDNGVSTSSTTDIRIFKDKLEITYAKQSAYSLLYAKYENLILQSAKGEQFHILFDESLKETVTTLKEFKIQVSKSTKIIVNGDASKVSYKNKIIVDHDTFPLEVTYTRPDQGQHFHSIGTGTAKEILAYDNSATICLYNTDSSSCPDVNETLKLNEFVSKMKTLKEEDYNNFIIYIADTTADKAIELPIDSLDVIYSSIQPAVSGQTSYIKLSQTKGVEKIYVTYTIITNVHISVKTGIETIQFGELHLENCNFDASCKNVELRADDIHCSYDVLPKWKKLQLSDNLNLHGTIPLDEKAEIHFLPDENSNDLVTEIKGINSIDLAINDGKFQIGSLLFYISRSRNYDALLLVNDEKTSDGIIFNISCIDNIPINEMPKITIQGENAKSEKCKMIFIGQWEDYYTSDVVQVLGYPSLTLKLNDTVPLRAEIKNTLNIVATNTDVGVTGPISFIKGDYSQKVSIVVSTTIESQRTTVRIKNGLFTNNVSPSFGSNKFFDIKNSTISLIVDEVNSTYSGNFPLGVYLIMDKDGISTVELKKASKNVNINSNIHISNLLPIGYNEKELKIIQQNWTLFSGPHDMMHPKTPIEYTYDLQEGIKPHGFIDSNNIMASKLEDKEEITNFVIYPTKLPSDLPFIFAYGDSSGKGEYYVSKDKASEMADLSDKIPNLINEITFYVDINMEEDVYLSIAPFEGKAKQFVIHGDTNRIINLVFPSAKKMNVTILGGIITEQKLNSQIGIDILTLTDCDFTKKSFSLTDNSLNKLEVDVDSMNSLVRQEIITSFKNEIHVTSTNIINFTTNGWSVSEALHRERDVEIKEEFFKSISFEASDELTLLVEKGLKKIKPMNLKVSYTKEPSLTVSLAAGWSEIENAKDMKLDTGDAKVTCILPFFPLPDVFTKDSDDFNIVFNNPDGDTSGEIDIVIKRGYVYTESRVFDMTQLPVTNQLVRAPDVIFAGKETKIDFVNDEGKLIIGNALAKNKSSIDLGRTEVTGTLTLDNRVDIHGKVSFKIDSSLVMDWSVNTVPKITVIEQESKTAPTSILLKFGNETVDHADFNDKYYRRTYDIIVGKFDCPSYLERVKFVSNNEYFNDQTKSNIMEKFCEGDSYYYRLSIWANKLLPVDDPTIEPESGDSEDKKSNVDPGTVTGITVAVVIVVAVVVGVVVYIFTRKKYETLLNSMPLDETGTEKYVEDL